MNYSIIKLDESHMDELWRSFFSLQKDDICPAMGRTKVMRNHKMSLCYYCNNFSQLIMVMTIILCMVKIINSVHYIHVSSWTSLIKEQKPSLPLYHFLYFSTSTGLGSLDGCGGEFEDLHMLIQGNLLWSKIYFLSLCLAKLFLAKNSKDLQPNQMYGQYLCTQLENSQWFFLLILINDYK